MSCTATHDESTNIDYPVHWLLQKRSNSVAFDGRMVEQAKLFSVLESVRWVSSPSQAQPWSFIVATCDQPEAFDCLHKSLSECEQRAMRNAPVLILCMAQVGTQRYGQSYHDLGLAVNSMTIQARSVGLEALQTTDFDAAYARRCLGIPRLHAPVVVLALGYSRHVAVCSKSRLPEPRPMGAFVCSGQWGRALRFDDQD